MEEVVPGDTLHAEGEECPLYCVRTWLRLERPDAGQVLEVLGSDREAARSVPRSAREEGHEVLGAEPANEGRVLIRKREGCRGA